MHSAFNGYSPRLGKAASLMSMQQTATNAGLLAEAVGFARGKM